jgi:glutathione S-transferase
VQVPLLACIPLIFYQKVAIVLEELGLKYETKFLEFGADEPGVKGPEHLKLNPNGRESPIPG